MPKSDNPRGLLGSLLNNPLNIMLDPQITAQQAEMDNFINSTLAKNKKLNFVDRILNKDKYPVLDLGNGWEASHMMSHAPKDNKNRSGPWIAYPNVIFDPDNRALKQLDPTEAEQYAKKSGELIEFGSEKDAERFAKNYKRYWLKGE